jgi:zinc/manganese transport system substrate-binding protein
MQRGRGLLLALAISLTAIPADAQTRLNVVASFSILGDFVSNVGGDRVAVTTLVGADGDVHVYTPTPADVRRISDARLLVVNGFGLEGWLPRLTQAAGGKATIVTATSGIATRWLQPILRMRTFFVKMRGAIWTGSRRLTPRCGRRSARFQKTAAR